MGGHVEGDGAPVGNPHLLPYGLDGITERDACGSLHSHGNSVPVLEDTDIVPIIDDFTNYLQTRISSMVKIHFEKPDHPIVLPLNQQLFEWVIENLCKNSADAMNGKGDITISITEEKNKVYIDVTDTGKGIPPKMQRRIFSPGYTSKSRGWGLGLTLAKRIIQNYHKGKLFVKSSVIDQGTTMRIQLKAK